MAGKIGFFAPQFAFPLAGLAGVMPPGDEAVVGRALTAAVHLLRHRVVDVVDEAAVASDAQQGGEHAFGHAVGGVGPLGVAPLGHKVAVAEHEAVSGGPPGRGRGPSNLPKNSSCVGKVGVIWMVSWVWAKATAPARRAALKPAATGALLPLLHPKPLAPARRPSSSARW